MSKHLLKNDQIVLELETMGAELTSIKDQRSDTEYLWNADPEFWKRHSPILFPIVGSLKNQTYRFMGKEYQLPQHGFARDMEFTLSHQNDHELWFSLEANEDTLKNYPFHFRLELGYRLEGRKITVLWKVINNDDITIYFSIGGHPAFLCPLKSEENAGDYYIAFDHDKKLRYLHVNEKGLAVKKPIDHQNILSTDRGLLPVNPHLFDYDALIIEDNQCHQVSLLTPSKKPYITVTFDAPLFGIWSPARRNAPFICIEPWYGRCDAEDFEGSLEERDWGNSLEPGKVFEAQYSIEVG